MTVIRENALRNWAREAFRKEPARGISPLGRRRPLRGSYQNLTLVSCRFSRKTGRSGGTCPCRKWNHCHTAVASGDRNHAKKGSVFCTPLQIENL